MLKNIVYLSEADFATLSTTGTITKDGQTLTYDPLNDVYCVPAVTYTPKYQHNIVFKPKANSGYGGVISFSIITTDPTPITKNTLDDILEVYLADGKRIPCSGQYRATSSASLQDIYAISYSSGYIRGWTYKFNSTGEGNPIQIDTGDLFDCVVAI